MVKQDISQKELKILCLMSGGVCAFRGCGESLVEPASALDDPVVIGEAAHIVASSRQGPRGEQTLEDDDRHKHTNLVLLCRKHHKIIDSQKRTFSVAVLRQMKVDHETRIRNATANPTTEPSQALRTDTVHSTLLPVTHLPQVVFSAATEYSQSEYEAVKKLVKFPRNENELTPFILREELLAFHDLRDKQGPFRDIVDTNKVTTLRATEMWKDAEGKRRYINLLNRALFKHTGHLGVRYDTDHFRFYFPALEKGRERSVKYTTL
jgi:hypothetical protein